MQKEEEKAVASLVNIDQATLAKWRDVLADHASQYGAIYAFSDTETTSNKLFSESTGLINRVLEWSICFAYLQDNEFHLIRDNKGALVCLDEPINPFAETNRNKRQQQSATEIPKGAAEVNGLSIPYLFGEEATEKRPKLDKPAPLFADVLASFKYLIGSEALVQHYPLYIAFHNADFDIMFLNSEMMMLGEMPIESLFIPIDSLNEAKRLISKSETKYSLDALYTYGKRKYPDQVVEIDRYTHTSLIDSLILHQVYNMLLKEAAA
jgi:hypothetical protein